MFTKSLTLDRFRWVTCQLDYLCGFSSDFERRKALGQLPPTLHETYLRLLHRFIALPPSTQTKIQMCLNFIAFSPIRLAINQLRGAISTPEIIGSHLDKDNMVSEEDIAFMCGSLVRKTDDGVFFEFAHFSVREFLAHESLAGNPDLKRYQISRERSNDMLLVQSLRFLQLSNYFDVELPNPESLFDDARASLATNRQGAVGFYPQAARLSIQLSREGHLNSTSASLMKSLFHPQKSSCLLLFATCLCFALMDHWKFHGLIQDTSDTPYMELAKMFLHNEFRPVHLAAALNLPDVCRHLVDAGSDLKAESLLGTPLELSITSILRLVLDGCDPMLIQKHHHLLYGPIRVVLGITQRNATFEIFEHTNLEHLAVESAGQSRESPLVLQALILAFVGNDFCILQKLLSLGMTLGDSMYARLIPDLMSQSRSYIQRDEEPLLSFLQYITSRMGAESVWPFEIGRLIWNTAVELDFLFARDPTVTDSRVSLSKDALASRAFAAIKSHDIDGLHECLADGRLDLSQRHRDPLEPRDKDDPRHLTLLHFAVLENNLQATEVLAHAGCDPSIPSVQRYYRCPPIHDCTSIEVFEQLLAHGAQATDVETYTGENIWHLYGDIPTFEIEVFDSFARKYPSKTAEALLTKSKVGSTPLQHLLGTRFSHMPREDHVEKAMALIETCQGTTDFWSKHAPLFGAAAAFGSERVIRRLIEVGAGRETIGPDLDTPLHRISIESSSESVQCLKEIFPEAVQIRFEGQLPLQAYLERCLHGNHLIDAAVAQQLLTAEALESIDGRGTTLWEYYCDINTPGVRLSKPSTAAILWAWLLSIDSAMQIYEKQSGKNGLILILSCLITLHDVEDLESKILPSVLDGAISGTDGWETIKSHSNVLRFLQFAIRKRAYSLVSTLIARGVSVHDQVDGYSSMQIAFQSPLVVSLSSDEGGKAILLETLDHSTIDHLNGYDRDGLTILHSLATSDSDGGQRLQWLIETLVHSGVDVNRFGGFKNDYTPMVYHLVKRSVSCATYLLEIGADPGLSGEHRSDAALKACWSGSITFLRKLLDHSKQTGMLIDWGRKSTLWLKFKDGSEIEMSDANAVQYACTADSAESLEVVQFYVDNGLIDDLEYASDKGWTAMHCAAFHGNAPIIEYLVSKGCGTMPETYSKSTPLHFSVREGYYEATKILIRLGAEDVADNGGMTPTIYASRSKNTSIIQLLGELPTPGESLVRGFARDALPRNRSKALAIALRQAIMSDDIKECKRLYSLHCPLNASIKGWSSLLLALDKGRLDIAEWLLDNGAITTTAAGKVTTDGPYINVIDACLGHSNLCKLLPKLVDQCLHDGSGWPLLGSTGILSAIRDRNPEALPTLFKLLQDRVADIRYCLILISQPRLSSWSSHTISNSGSGSTVTNVPCTEVLHKIVNKVCKLNRKEYGTALHSAALKNNVSAARLLLEHGAAIDTLSSTGETALRMASSPEMITLLVHYGASLVDHFSHGWLDCISWDIKLFNTLVSAYSEVKTTQDQVDGIPTFLPTIFHTRGSISCSNSFISPPHLVSFLRAGLDLTLELGSEISPMHLAIANRASSTFVLNSNPNLETMTPFPWHIELSSDLTFLHSMFRQYRRRLAAGDFVRIANLQPARGWSPLCIAARSCELELMRNCLCLGAEVDFEGSPHGSALVLACACGFLGAVRLLVQAGARLSYQGQNGHRSVFTFCRSKEVRRWLLVERFTEQRRIDTRPHWGNGERVRPWAGTAIARLKLVGDRAMFYHETLMEYAGRLARMRKEWRGVVIPPICIDGIVYRS